MKRYEKYKPSGIEWIGEVPEQWGLVKTKFVCTLNTGNSLNAQQKAFYGEITEDVPSRPYIASKDIDRDTEFIDYDNGIRIPLDELSFEVAPANSTLLCIEGGSAGKKMGFVDREVCYVNKLCCFNSFKINPKYQYYFVKSRPYWEVFSQNIQGMIGGVSVGVLKEIKMPLPSPAEQEAIAAYLDARCGDIDKVVATQEKRIALLNEMKQSIITQAVTRGLNPDAKMKDSGVEWIGMVPEHWEVKKLKFVSNSISKGAGITKEQVVEDGDTQCVRYGEIYTKYNHSFDSCVSATNKDLHPVLQYFGYGDILFTCTGELVEEIGKSVVYLGHERCLAGGDILVVSHNQDPSFLNYALNSYAQIQKSEGRAKLKVVHISTYDISNLLLALPPIEEQKQIADEIDRRCSSIDKQIGAVTRQIELLREYKQSLITDVVAGKVKVC